MTKEETEDVAADAASRAIDLDRATRTKAKLSEEGIAWLKVELDRTYLIKNIEIYYMFYTDWYYPWWDCAKSKTSFKACVDENSNVDVSVYQGEVKQKSCGTLQLTYGLEKSDQIYTLICNTAGDTVKLSKTEGEIKVFEIIVYRTGIRHNESYTHK